MSGENNFHYNLLIDWLIHPHLFFKRVTEQFAQRSSKKQTLIFLASFALPLLCGFELYLLWTRFAIYIIADRIVSSELIFAIFMVAMLILSLIFLTFIPGRGITKRINEILQDDATKHTVKEQKKNFDNSSKKRVRTFSRLYLTRNNLFFLPAAIVLFGMLVTNISRAWNIYQLGTYLTFTVWILNLWTGYFIVSSLYSVGAEFPHIRLKITKTQLAWRIGIALGLYIGFVVGLTFPLTAWLGATNMPFWFKIAMFLLHGN